MRARRIVGTVAVASVLLAGCAGSNSNLGQESDPPVDESAAASPAQTPVEEPAETPNPTPTEDPLGPPVTVTILMDVDRTETITELLKQFGEQGWCETGLATVLDGSGGQAVTLDVAGVDTPFSGRFVPSPMNGPDLPCQVEAVITGVPSGATAYVAEQTGQAKGSILAGKASVTGAELEANGNMITLE